MVHIQVQGGTRAGSKRPLRPAYPMWLCKCGRANEGYLTRCLTSQCNEKRPTK